MSSWQQPYLGIASFPKTITAFEVERFFTLDAAELAALRTFRSTTSRLGAALQRGFLKLTGNKLRKLASVPRLVLRHLAQQIEDPSLSIASLRSLYAARIRTLHEHQAWAVQILNFSKLGDKRASLVARLRVEGRSLLSVDALVDFAKAWCYQHRVLMPTQRTLRSLGSDALAHADEALRAEVVKSMPVPVRRAWLKALTSAPPSGSPSRAAWLHRGPKKGARKGFGEQFEKLAFLRDLGVHQYPLGIPTEKQRHYATALRRRRPASIRELVEPARTLQVVCFMRSTLMRVTDSIVLTSGQRTLDIVRRATEQAQRAEAKAAPSLREALNRILAVAKRPDLDAQAKLDEIVSIASPLEVRVFKSRAAAVRDRLIDNNAEVRALLRSVVTRLPLRVDSEERLGGSLDVLRELFEKRDSQLPKSAAEHVRPLWRDEVAGDDRARARRAFEAACMMDLRRAFRRGTVWVEDSDAFRSREQILIPRERWERERVRLAAVLGVNGSVAEYLRPLIQQAEEGLARVADAVRAGDLTIERGSIRLAALKPESLPPELEAQRAELRDRVGSVQLPDLMLEMDSLTRFSRHLLGRAPRSDRELLPLYGALIATGTDYGPRGVALMTPGLPESHIVVAMRSLEDETALRRANDEVTAYIRTQRIARQWGAGTIASSDMMSLDASRQLWLARNDPRRGVPAIGVYQHISDQWDIFHSLPVLVKTRQAGAALEGIVRHLDLGIEQLAVDTHGHTHFIMAMFPFFGAAMCPRLKSLSQRRLMVPVGVEIPDVLSDVVVRGVSIPGISRGFDALLRVAASIREGTTSAMVANDRFGSSAARGDEAHAAGEHLGRLRLTIFLCDYFTNEPFRREMHRILNHGESIHQLERVIFSGRIAPKRGRRLEELGAISGSLTLLTNLVLAWNATRLQQALAELSREGTRVSEEAQAHISPAFFEHINFRGRFRFDFDRYVATLFAEQSVARAVGAR